ncbi:hypothetical protein [Algoriphagus sp.]|uniref:hypothetical protein n=1 Tax=Algoriphagus sp. TaxID=1872435 RepID=UPI003F6E5FBE
MQNRDTFDHIHAQFLELETLDSLEKLNTFIKDYKLNNSIDSFYTKYPIVDFRLTVADIEKLKADGIINPETNKLAFQNFPDDPLSKLLAAVLWKNGDIHKVQHLIDGITGREGDRTQYSLVFKQYGASLSSEHEPIVDQHVLRAFEIYSLKGYSEPLVEKLRKKSLYKSNDKPILNKYRIWFVNVIEKVPESQKTPFKEKLDKVLFQLGKKVKI